MYRFSQWSRWSIQAALLPAFSSLLAFALGLYLLAYPPPRRYKKLSILLLALPVAFAFTHQGDLLPDRTANDTFARFLYIWLAHMSYEVILLEFTPKAEEVKENVKLRWQERLRQAYKVLFDRNHSQVLEDKSAVKKEGDKGKHGYSKNKFLLYHAVKVTFLFFIQEFWYDLIKSLPIDRSTEYNADNAYFFRRIFSSPSSLNWHEMYFRVEKAFDWTVINMFLYESYHSFFAVLFVGILRLDSHDEWTLALCGSFSEAWSVRRYWGKHWHNYIYHSFSSHTKIITRGWLGLEQGKMSTRLLENTIVFLLSGLGHSLVRWQQYKYSDVWAICVWYVAQMLPIFAEHVIQSLWRKAKRRMGISADDRRFDVFEKAVGYVWTAWWFLWSVPKYVHTREAWTMALVKKRYAAIYSTYDKVTRNDTG